MSPWWLRPPGDDSDETDNSRQRPTAPEGGDEPPTSIADLLANEPADLAPEEPEEPTAAERAEENGDGETEVRQNSCDARSVRQKRNRSAD